MKIYINIFIITNNMVMFSITAIIAIDIIFLYYCTYDHIFTVVIIRMTVVYDSHKKTQLNQRKLLCHTKFNAFIIFV